MSVPRIERSIGIEVYATQCRGIGGVIKQRPEDFLVEEILVDSSKAEISQSESFQSHSVLSSSSLRNGYLLCVLVKRDWDTFVAVKEIAKRLGINAQRIHVVGIKDAKAVTAQFITIEGITREEVGKVEVKDVEIHPIGYLHDQLSSYYLLGNQFHIVIRAINHAESTVRTRTIKIVDEFSVIGGVPNFFGHQRFGTMRPITHLVGKAITRGSFANAVMFFLAEPFPTEHPDSRTAREELMATMDYAQALRNFPKQLRYERMMLVRLVEKPADFLGAFCVLPLKLQELFVQAYQSYLFNKFLSQRIANGLPLNNVEVGDYVVNVERSGLAMVSMFKVVTNDTLTEINKAVKAGRMRLALPLIGFKQSCSGGVEGENEKRILEAEGTSPKAFRIDALPDISCRGRLRTAVSILKDFSLNQVTVDSTDSQKYKVPMSLMLYRGSYATVVLRELMKPANPVKAGF